ncbi:glutathione S-transferase [Devosia insulae DS-56]|uniref:Glutathione S-transferase n=1 Tax=Devosia insulae DS-56 TaxID=1116389 RepID=A0A1E5XMZ6_9HYPH|nr:glutathione S-transferase N-terminal domain-containing protein [Devosia insulae]OEO29945.1 glutathione S-transferase [Devosia insulae DS-56]
MYQLFYAPGACSMAVHIILEEVGAEFELFAVSVANRDTQREPYLSINPKGRVPALRIRGEAKVLTELPAILRYLASRYPEHALAQSADPLLEARITEWLAWLSGWLHSVGYGLIWRPERFDPDPSHAPALAAQGKRVVEAAYQDIERALADTRTWSVEERFSIVDPFLLVFYRWGSSIGFSMRDRYPAWTRHAQLTLQRPAVQRAMAREGIALPVEACAALSPHAALLPPPVAL